MRSDRFFRTISWSGGAGILIVAVLVFGACRETHSGEDGGDGPLLEEEDAGSWDDGPDAADQGDPGPDRADGTEHGPDGDPGTDNGCPKPQPYETYCINTSGDECDYIGSYCSNGMWMCRPFREFPPAPPEFDDWAWRCGVYRCFAQNIPAAPGPDWQEEKPYVPPDPGSLTGEWRMVADNNDIVPLGCERQPGQYAFGAALAVNPLNPDVMYAGFQTDADCGSFVVTGVFKSVDGGRTWFEARAGLGTEGCRNSPSGGCTCGPEVYRLFVDPDEPDVVFASTYEYGLYRTADGGRFWNYVDLPYWCNFVGPVAKGGNGLYWTACGGILFRSEDTGVTWSEQPLLSNFGRYVTSFGFDDRLPDRVWVGRCMGTSPRAGEGYLFLSDDGGESWTEMGQDIDAYCQGYGGTWSVEVCDADPEQMAAAVWQCGLFLSSDGGLSFRKAGAPLDGSNVFFARYAPLPDRCRLYASARHTYWTEDGGETWTLEQDHPLYGVFFNPYLPEMMMGMGYFFTCFDCNLFEMWVKE